MALYNNCKDPSSLPKGTPVWFKEWHSGCFWHFKYKIESKTSLHDKLLWIILTVTIGTAVVNMFHL